MEHESHLPDESPLAIRIFGWVAGAVVAGGLLYYLFTISGLDTSANIAAAYDNCKSGILANVSRPEKAKFLNTPDNSKLVASGDGYTMLMKLSITDGSGQRVIDYNCAVAKQGDLLQPLKDFLSGR